MTTEYVLGEALDVIRFYRLGWEPVRWHTGLIRWGKKQTDPKVCLPSHTEWRTASAGECAVLRETGGLPEFKGMKFGKEEYTANMITISTKEDNDTNQEV